MANAASTIEIELEIRDAINRLGRLERELTKSSQSFDRAAQATRKFEGAINKAKAGLVAFFAAISLQKLAQLSDAMTQFENRVKLATNSLVQQLAVQQQLFLVAQKTALPLEDVGQLYSRLRIAAEQLGASQRDLINLTETVGLALKASGTSAASAQGALLQLGQALNSPRVQAEEFNSLIDGMPNLLREVEKQLGLTAGGLKKFVTDGQLSNKKFFDAILASQKALTQQANSSASTIEQANQRVANSFTSLIGAIDDKLGASKFFTGFIDGLASGIDKLSIFLGLTTQATGGGGANLDEVIRGAAPSGSQYAFPTIGPERVTEAIGFLPNYIQQINSLEEIKELEGAILETKAEQAKAIAKAVNSNTETVKIIGAQNVPLKEAVGYINLENKLLDSIIQKRRIELQQNKENLTYLEQATNYLKEQFGLTDRTAGAIVSGVSAAGPNASRAANIAQSKSPEEAAVKLILSNEKVAKAIDSSFEILFDTIDPLIDILGDLISAINRLIGALIENATNAAEGLLDTVGLGPNGYIFGGGLARDLEAAFSSSRPGGPTNQQKAFAQADSIFENIADTPSTRDQLQPKIDELADLIPDLGLTEVINRITQNTEEAVASLEAVQIINFKTLAAASSAPYLMNQIGKEIKKVNEKIAETEEKSKIVIQGLIEAYIQEPLNALDDLTQSAQDQIDAIDFQNMSIEEQIQFRYQESIATIEQQKALADLIDDEDLRTQLLNAANKAEAKTIELKNKQLDQLEREQQLLALQKVETGLQALLSDFERTIEKIDELVQGLFDQVQELLFSDFSPLGPQEQFAQAQSTYESLLENAFDADATEEDIKLLQAFVNEYLTAARNVFKSSTAFTSIFEGVLGDLTGLGLQTSFNAPIQASSNLSSDLEEILSVLDEDFAEVVNSLIASIDSAALAFAQQQIEYITEVAQIPLTLSGDDIVIDTSGISETVELTSDNFSLDSTNLDLSLAMSTSMFTVDTSGLNFGTITPTATAGTPNLGTITPTVSLDTSSVTSAFSTLTTNVNNAISSFVSGLSETYAKLGIINIGGTGSFVSNATTFSGNQYSAGDYGFSVKSGSNTSFADLTATYLQSGEEVYPYGIYFTYSGNSYAYYYETLSDANLVYNAYKDVFNPTKYGFRQGGLVPDPMDTIPAMLSPGEYILSPETVRRYGVSNLNRLNSGDTAALNATSDPEVKRLLAELIVAVRENDTEVNVYTDMAGQTKASIEEFRSELRERTRRQGEQYVPARYI
jgi:tape measure domain-containing protein